MILNAFETDLEPA